MKKEILLAKEINPDLGSRNKIEKLFKNIDESISELIMNFEGVEFMGRSFAQEYLNQKNKASVKITEINVPKDVKKLFDIIMELNGH